MVAAVAVADDCPVFYQYVANSQGMKKYFSTKVIANLLFAASCAAGAGEADVTTAEIAATGENVYRINTTVRHADEGWDHYANKWEVLAPDGAVLGTRVLHHPHVDEQPFTRSLSGIEIPEGIDSVTIRAYDSVHEAGGAEFILKVPR